MTLVERLIARIRALLRQEHWWGEFGLSGIGAPLFVFFSLVESDNRKDTEIYLKLYELYPFAFISTWITVFASMHVFALFTDIRWLRIVSIAALLWMYTVILWTVIDGSPWTRGLAFFISAIFIYFMALTYYISQAVLDARMTRSRKNDGR